MVKLFILIIDETFNNLVHLVLSWNFQQFKTLNARKTVDQDLEVVKTLFMEIETSKLCKDFYEMFSFYFNMQRNKIGVETVAIGAPGFF